MGAANGNGSKPDPISAILRGRETAVRLAPAQGGEPEVVWFQIDFNAIAELEEKYGSYEDLGRALESKPATVMRHILARCVLNCAEEEAGKRMLGEETDNYYAAVQAAIALAYGSNSEQAGKVASLRMELMREVGLSGMRALEEGLTTLRSKASESDGAPGTTPGVPRAKTRTGSGR